MRKVLPAIVIAMVLISCSKHGNEYPNNVNERDKAFMLEIAKAAKAEVLAGNMASSKSSNSAVRQFGQTMISNYNSTQEDVQALANKLNLVITDTVFSENENLLSHLSGLSGHSFDTAYMNSRVLSLQAILNSFKKEVDNGNNPYVRYYFVNKYLDEVRTYYLKADSIAYTLR